MDARRRRGFVLALALAMELALMLAAATSARAADEADVVREAAALLEQIATNPDSGIPAENLRQAEGILLMPHIVETQIGIGRKRGHGVFFIRDEHGEWGPPQFVDTSGVSLGAAAGRSVTDVVVTCLTRKAAEDYGKTSVVLVLGLHTSGSLRHRDRFYPTLSERTLRHDGVAIFARRRGLVAGYTFRGERSWGHSSAPADRKAGAKAEPGAAGGHATAPAPAPAPANASATAPAPAPAARPASHSNPAGSGFRSRSGGESPEAERLRQLLTVVTRRPPAPVAAAGKTDATVRPASGVKPDAGRPAARGR